jgi:alpha-ketoglutaric semialdehyde dehydrogenase
MEIHGKNIVGFDVVPATGGTIYRAYNPREGKVIEPAFIEAGKIEVDRALDLAAEAAVHLGRLSAEDTAEFLLAIRDEIAGLGDALIERADAETALGTERLKSERDRTTNQIKLFADIVKEGSWVDARIDTALPDRKPLPRPDIRRMLQPIGPVVVFGASNFPLAFSVAGGDTTSAFAARNPVIVKAHPAHPGTSELVAQAISKAAKKRGLPQGTFSMLHSLGTETSLALAQHPKTRAVAFTGSQRAGRALFDAAAQRPDPIPVYAEMGSVNPVVAFPSVFKERAGTFAEGLYRSVLLGVGQFCTCPGLAFGVAGDGFEQFVQKLSELFEQGTPGTMLNPMVRKGYTERFESVRKTPGVDVRVSKNGADPQKTEGQPGLLVTDARTWLQHHALHEEIFGPATVVVRCQSDEEILTCSKSLDGSLTATIHGNADELGANPQLFDVLSKKAGRLIFNGFPTGVEVGYAMNHGGPYPATTDEKFTSVGTAAIYRFARPVCYQGFPEQLLPVELQNANPRNIFRLVDGRLTRDRL